MNRSTIFALLLITLATRLVAADEPQLPKPPEPTAEHRFLKRFAGEWECANVGYLEGQEIKSKGTMSGKMIGEYWATISVTAETPGAPYRGQGTFGFDSQKTKKCFGTWTDSMSPFLWKYEGKIDGNKLILGSEAPDPTDPNKMLKTLDTWEFKSDDLIVLTGQMEGEDGKMVTFMKSTCRRKTDGKKSRKKNSQKKK